MGERPLYISLFGDSVHGATVRVTEGAFRALAPNRGSTIKRPVRECTQCNKTVFDLVAIGISYRKTLSEPQARGRDRINTSTDCQLYVR